MTAAAVVEQSLRAVERGRLRVITGWQNRLVVGVQRFLPSALLRAVGAQLFRPPPGSA